MLLSQNKCQLEGSDQLKLLINKHSLAKFIAVTTHIVSEAAQITRSKTIRL